MKEVYQTPFTEVVFITLSSIIAVSDGGNEGTGNENWSMNLSDDFTNPMFGL